MHTIVLTSLWFFEWLKMWCHQLCLKKMDPKAEQFRFYVFTWMKLGDDRVKIHADLTDVWSQPCFVLHRLQMDWGIQSCKNVSFEDGHCLGRPVFPGMSKLCFFSFVKNLVKNIHIYNMWNMWKMWRFNWHSWKNCVIVYIFLTWEKSWQDGYPIS